MTLPEYIIKWCGKIFTDSSQSPFKFRSKLTFQTFVQMYIPPFQGDLILSPGMPTSITTSRQR